MLAAAPLHRARGAGMELGWSRDGAGMEPAAFGGRGLQGGLLLALTRGLWKSICTGAGICSVQ